MFARYFEHPDAIARHRSAPFREERERFLAQLEAWGAGREKLREASCYLLHVIDTLRLRRLRNVTAEEIEQAAVRWIELRRERGHSRIGEEATLTFKRIARQFLKFIGKIKPPGVHQPFGKYLSEFVHAMKNELAYAAPTLTARRFRAAHFLRWYGERPRRFREIGPANVEAYLDFSSGSDLRARRNQSECLRAFFRYAARRGWCRSALAAAIPILPLLHRPPEEPQGPGWKDVVRLLESARGSEPSEIRDRAALLLFSHYGLRGEDVVNLLVSDLDWKTKRLVVCQRKPENRELRLDQEVVTALRRYIENARPHCSCPNLFVTTAAPFRPLHPRTMLGMVRGRMLRLGIRSDHCGSGCLRHARATRLLDTGRSFQEVADFLGHASTQRIKLYASFSIRKLREVAVADLVGAL